MNGEDDGIDILGDVRDLLDPLDRSVAAPGLAVSTIEMAAVTAATAVAEPAPPAAWRRWLPAAVVVVTGLVAGYAAGRVAGPDPDESTLRYLPVVENVDVLHEAGSVAFLDEIAARAYPPPRPFPFGRPPEARPDGEPEAWPQLDEAVEALRAGPFGPETPFPEMVARKEYVEEMDDDALRVVADRATRFGALPRGTAHDVIELARELAESDDARREALLAAARAWHRWVAWSDPADRQAVVALGRDERLEWLDRRARMAAGRGQWPPGRQFPGGRGFGDGGSATGRKGREERRGADGPARDERAEGEPTTPAADSGPAAPTADSPSAAPTADSPSAAPTADSVSGGAGS